MRWMTFRDELVRDKEKNGKARTCGAIGNVWAYVIKSAAVQSIMRLRLNILIADRWMRCAEGGSNVDQEWRREVGGRGFELA